MPFALAMPKLSRRSFQTAHAAEKRVGCLLQRPCSGAADARSGNRRRAPHNRPNTEKPQHGTSDTRFALKDITTSALKRRLNRSPLFSGDHPAQGVYMRVVGVVAAAETKVHLPGLSTGETEAECHSVYSTDADFISNEDQP